MDLSKSFDCLPHDLLLLKLESDGLSKSALNLLKSYLSNRKQCVRIGQSVNEMLDIYKDVPQGTIFHSVLFNVFINDISLFVKKTVTCIITQTIILSHFFGYSHKIS
jgi:hypothetical protein